MLAVLDGLKRPRPAGIGRRAAGAGRDDARRRARAATARFARLLHTGGLRRHLLAPATVAAGRGEVAAGLDGVPTAAPALRSDRGTTHISVVDGAGNAAAFTASNGCHSGVIVPGTGLHLNNMIGEEDLAAGRHLRPGTRLTSMQAPTMLDRGRRAAAGGGLVRLQPAALGDHPGDRER